MLLPHRTIPAPSPLVLFWPTREWAEREHSALALLLYSDRLRQQRCSFTYSRTKPTIRTERPLKKTYRKYGSGGRGRYSNRNKRRRLRHRNFQCCYRLLPVNIAIAVAVPAASVAASPLLFFVAAILLLMSATVDDVGDTSAAGCWRMVIREQTLGQSFFGDIFCNFVYSAPSKANATLDRLTFHSCYCCPCIYLMCYHTVCEMSFSV